MDVSSTNLQTYKPGEQTDLLLATWWAKLHSNGDLFNAFPVSLGNLSSFLLWFRPPNSLIYTVDGEGVSVAAWFEPVISGTLMGIWVEPKYRRSREVAQLVGKIYDAALSTYRVILGITKQERLLREHVKVGYEIVGGVPYLYDGETAWMVCLTREGFEKGWWGKRAGCEAEQRTRVH
jgi:hypothetical protein